VAGRPAAGIRLAPAGARRGIGGIFAQVAEEPAAVQAALRTAHADDLLVVLPIDVEGVRRRIVTFDPFAERGRIGRLLGAVAQNPRELGVGIDEDTAIAVRGSHFEVIGSGGVHVVDGTGVTHSNIAEAEPQRALSMFDVRLHVLAAGDAFDLSHRRPADTPEPREAEALEIDAAGRTPR
jgi:hypothetical protein